MAPFRPPGRTNRSGRSQIDHDVFEGLPIRQWRQVETMVGPPVLVQPTVGKNAWPELPMPRDSHLLPEHSQQLLRAARSGKLYRPPTPPNDEEKELGDEDEEAKDTQRGFTARKWAQVPRHLEGPEREYLAKRRKGLPSVYSNHSGVAGPLAQNGAMRKTKVKKVDAEGNVSVYEVLVPEGQTVEGEVVQEAVVRSAPAAAPGTVVEGLGVVNAEGVLVASELLQPTPPRRKPPPPRRKVKKGPGRKKRVLFTEGLEGSNGIITGASESSQAGAPGMPSIKIEGETGSELPGDTPMADAQEGEEDEDEGEEGEEGEEGDDDEDREEGELSPTPDEVTPAKPATPSAPATTAPELPSNLAVEVSNNYEPSSSPEMPLASAVHHSRQGSSSQIPTISIGEDTPAQAKDEDVHFSDGEVDLFGSLEAHLGMESKGSSAR